MSVCTSGGNIPPAFWVPTAICIAAAACVAKSNRSPGFHRMGIPKSEPPPFVRNVAGVIRSDKSPEICGETQVHAVETAATDSPVARSGIRAARLRVGAPPQHGGTKSLKEMVIGNNLLPIPVKPAPAHNRKTDPNSSVLQSGCSLVLGMVTIRSWPGPAHGGFRHPAHLATVRNG